MNRPQNPLTHDNGFVLVTVLVVMLLIVFLGMSAINTTTVELQIASNDKLNKESFYEADGGLALASELLEQNISCPQGFGTVDLDTDGVGGIDYTYNLGDGSATLGYNPDQLIKVLNRVFWQKTLAGVAQPSDIARDFFSPANYAAGAPHSNFTVGGDTVFSKGGSLQMAAGYEGVGKGVTGGGAAILYDVYSQHLGTNNSQSLLLIQWRHLLGQEGNCLYAP